MADDGEDSASPSVSSDSMDEDRPLKKARYVWQIKGQYRWNRSRSRSCSNTNHQPSRLRTHNSSHPEGHAHCSLAPMEEVQCPTVRWQTRQMARAVVDNTINQVLDDMGFVPLPDYEEDVISFDVFPPMGHNREGIENAAVLMAIQSHGLQKPCHCSHSYSLAPSSLQHIPFHHRPSTPLLPDPPVLAADACTPSTSESQVKCSGKGDFFSETVGETDFLAQAVAVAIQKKGLGSYSPTEHG